jgi:hypothetical protein
MRQYVSKVFVLSILLIAAGCTSNSQTAQQHPACPPGDQYPRCMQMAQSRMPGPPSNGSQSTTWPNNPEMRDFDTAPPMNPPLQLISPGIAPMPWGIGVIRR